MDSVILLLYSKRSNVIFVPDLQLSWICFRVRHILCWGGVLVWEWKDPGTLEGRRRLCEAFPEGYGKLFWNLSLSWFFFFFLIVVWPFFLLVSNYPWERANLVGIWICSVPASPGQFSTDKSAPPLFLFLPLLPSRGGWLIVILWGRNSGVWPIHKELKPTSSPFA